ncbi:MAG: hypothetical protein DKM50_09135 [Candidatus Margulisiibacteriota bacterium]|nr:MAG: hypothetical protein DKM50_09135 [Candidatus Margulisiibacteriota bacterium]
MTSELGSLIEKIKKEGIEEARSTADKIIEQAHAEAKNKLHEADKQKEEIIRQAKEESERIIKNGEEALRLAGRDTVLALKSKIIDLFDAIMKREISGEMSPEVIKEMLLKIAAQFNTDGTTALEVVLSPADKTALDKMSDNMLKKVLAEELTIKGSDKVEKGFRIGLKDSNSYYDFTDEAIAQTLKAYLNPRIVKILDRSSNG